MLVNSQEDGAWDDNARTQERFTVKGNGCDRGRGRGGGLQLSGGAF